MLKLSSITERITDFMKCDICGAELSANDKVCGICGNVIGNKPDTVKTKEKQRVERSDAYTAAEHRLTGDESIVVIDTDIAASKFCTRCGRLLDKDTHLCPICDVRELELMRVRESNKERPRVRTERAEAEKRKEQRKKNITAAVIMALLATFVITAFMFFKLLGGGMLTQSGNYLSKVMNRRAARR